MLLPFIWNVFPYYQLKLQPQNLFTWLFWCLNLKLKYHFLSQRTCFLLIEIMFLFAYLFKTCLHWDVNPKMQESYMFCPPVEPSTSIVPNTSTHMVLFLFLFLSNAEPALSRLLVPFPHKIKHRRTKEKKQHINKPVRNSWVDEIVLCWYCLDSEQRGSQKNCSLH